MDLWIRSQDRKELFKINEIHAEDSYLASDEFGFLGEYKTKERALEILDEIEKILKPKGIIKFDGILDTENQRKVSEMLDNKYLIFNNNVELLQQVNTFVYEMPEK